MSTSKLFAPQARRWWKVLLWMLVGVTLTMALIPAPPKALSTGWDKSDHLGAFAALAVVGRLAWGRDLKVLVLLSVGLVGLGGLIEVLQLFVPQRQADWHDVVADALGVALGLCLGAILSWLRPRLTAAAKD